MSADTVMGADPVMRVPLARRPFVSSLDPLSSETFAGQARADPVLALAIRMRVACASAIDVDEVAAILEASGINDRVAAREYGAPTVFALAAEVLAQAPPRDPGGPAVADSATPPFRAVRVLAETLMRTSLYFTPLVIGVGAAHQVQGVGGLPTLGTLVVGWGCGQAFAYLGYGALGVRGPAAATRLLAGGFAVVAAVWSAVLALDGTPWPRGYAVAGAQLALFAVTAAALVTGRERTVLASAVPCWVAAGAVWLGGGHLALAALGAALLVLVLVAYRPAVRRGDRRSGGRWRSRRQEYSAAIRFGFVGSGQAVLLVIVALSGPNPTAVPPEAVPLLCAVPLIELALIWHQWRVNSARAALDDRVLFGRRLARVSRDTALVLSIPILAGAVLVALTWTDGAVAGVTVPGGGRTAAAVLLCGLYALCLILAAHRRTGTAAVLVWWPALLITVVGQLASANGGAPAHVQDVLAAATLLGTALPGLAVVVFVLRDPESYR